MKRIAPEGRRRVPLLIWGRRPPADAVALLERLASQPYVVEHVAAMPDLHLARDVAVGTVFATEDVVVPAALGGDLGCGVTAVPLGDAHRSLDDQVLRRWLAIVSERVPIDRHRGTKPFVDFGNEVVAFGNDLSTAALGHDLRRFAATQLGTLGEGNHFVELDRDAEGRTFLLVHSGSRGFGAAVAAHHLRVAQSIGVGSPRGIPTSRLEGQACLLDLECALTVARMNRRAIARVALEALEEASGVTPVPDERIDVHHNFVAREVHFGLPLLVHRKGAIAAPAGRLALVPGSMGTASYVVEGLGAPESFGSASHGAGRVLTRTEARAKIRPPQVTRAMGRVVFDERRISSLIEEAPSAYRDVREVLDDEADLVRARIRLEPIAVLKG